MFITLTGAGKGHKVIQNVNHIHQIINPAHIDNSTTGQTGADIYPDANAAVLTTLAWAFFVETPEQIMQLINAARENATVVLKH